MSTISRIEKIRNEAVEVFKMTTQRQLLECVKSESYLKTVYKGREIFELLQNIDDAFDAEYINNNVSDKQNDTTGCVAHFEICDNSLTVSNNGRPFTLETLERLCQGNVSSKSNVIGCKGIGFRSVLNWSNHFMIYSSPDYDIHSDEYIAVEFSKELAESQLRNLASNDHISNQLKELRQKGYPDEYPIFKAPSAIEPINKKYNTVIKFFIEDKSVLDRIRLEIKEFDATVLLFLPNIENISFVDKNYKDSTIVFKRRKESGSKVSIIKEGESVKTYYFASKNTEIRLDSQNEDNQTRLSNDDLGLLKMAVAIPLELNDNNASTEYPLYSFFPIKDVPCPFPAILHAGFELTANRNDLDTSSESTFNINKLVFKHLLEFYVDTVEKGNFKERCLDLLCPSVKRNSQSNMHNFKFGDKLGRFGLETYYFNYCKVKDIFYSLGGSRYFNGNDTEMILLRDWPISINDSVFGNIVTVESTLWHFARQISSVENYEDSKVQVRLKKSIDENSVSWSPEYRVQLFKWWWQHDYIYLPKLLKNNTGDFITSNNDAVFLTGQIDNLPKWTHITLIDVDDERNLLIFFENEIKRNQAEELIQDTDRDESSKRKRILARLIREKALIHFQEQTSRAVISPVNSSIDNQYERAVDFVKWLWPILNENESNKSISDSETGKGWLKEIRFKLPSQDGTVVNAENLYLDSSFGEPFRERLFAKLDYYAPLCNVELGGKINELERFYIQLGVTRYPKIRLTNLEALRNKPHLHSTFSKFERINYQISKVEYILGVENLFASNTTSDIISWILNDKMLFTHLNSQFESDDSIIYFRPGNSRKDRTCKGNEIGDNILRKTFSDVPWIEINGKKYAPSRLIFSKRTTLNIIFEGKMSCISETEIKKIANEINRSESEVTSLLFILGMKNSLIDLSASYFYEILLKLPEISDMGESESLSREIYRLIIESDDSKLKKFQNSCPEKSKFLSIGKVLARKGYNGDSEYLPINEVYFSSSAVADFENKPFIDIPARRGNKDVFKNVLGIKSFQRDYKILEVVESHCNEDFSKDFENFCACIKAYKDDFDDISKMSVKLVKSLRVSSTDNDMNEKVLGDSSYAIMRDKDSSQKWYVVVGNCDNYKDISRNHLSVVMEQIFNEKLNFPSREFLSTVKFMFLLNKSQRRFFIKSHFGDDRRLEEAELEIRDYNDFKEKLKDTITKRCPDFNTAMVDDIEWGEYNSHGNMEKIVRLLRESGLNCSDLSQLLEHPINIPKYNHECLSNAFDKNKSKFKSIVYEHVRRNPSLLKTQLVSIWNEYRNLIHEIVTDDIRFNAIDEYNKILNEWYLKKRIDPTYENSTFDKIYDKNIRELNKIDPNAELLDAFKKEPERESLLYFDDDSSIKAYRNFIQHEKDSNEKRYNYGFMSGLLGRSTVADKVSPGKGPIKDSNNGTTFSVSNSVKQERKTQKQGDVAEYIVIRKLLANEIPQICEFLGMDYKVSWVSGACDRMKCRFNDDADTFDSLEADTKKGDKAGYDISAISSDGKKKLLIEVKSSSGDTCDFKMSAREYVELCHDRKDGDGVNVRARIIFVSNLSLNDSNCAPSVHYLDYSVGDDSHFILTPIDYDVSYQ